jgi:hypothetical protein
MISNLTNQNNQINNNNKKNKDIKLGGFPPIIYLNKKNKQIKEFAKINEDNNEQDTKNIGKLNILDIKNILGV